jgi:hypothetical protein
MPRRRIASHKRVSFDIPGGDTCPSHRFKNDADPVVGPPLRTAAPRNAVDHQVKMLRQSDWLSMM